MQPYYKNKIKHKTSNKVCYKIVFLANLNIILILKIVFYPNKFIRVQDIQNFYTPQGF
jgi:hypothetical protein